MANILLVGPFWSNAKHGSETGVYNALCKLGHQVDVWDYRSKRCRIANGKPEDVVDVNDIDPDDENNYLYGNTYDIILALGAGLTDPIRFSKLWKSLKGFKILHNSEPIRLENYRGRVENNKCDFDLFLTFDESEIPLYKSELGIEAKWLPQGFNDNWYKPLELTPSQRVNKLAFVGSVGPKWDHRSMFLQRIDSQFPLTVATIFDAKMVNRVYGSHLAVLNLGLYLPELGPMIDLRGEGLQNRIYEAVGSGRICITNEIDCGTNQLFTDKENILFYNTNNLEEVINLVFDKSERERMESNIVKIRHQHTYKARMESMLEMIGV